MSEQSMAYEEVPGSRTLQQAVEQPQRPRWAWEELRPGDLIQDKDEWQNEDGRWHPLVIVPGASTQLRDGLRARRPHNITALHKERDEARAQGAKLSAEVLADAQQAATQLQSERDEFQTALIESRLALKRKVAEVMEVCKERDDALTALKSAQRARDELQLQVDELRADRTNEVTARQVQQVLHRWATELEWSADCFGSATREQVHGVQNTLITVMQRIESMIDAEGSRADA